MTNRDRDAAAKAMAKIADPTRRLGYRGDSWKRAALDIAMEHTLDELASSTAIKRVDHISGHASALVARCGGKVHTLFLDGDHGPEAPSR